MMNFVLASDSCLPGHPDKLCDRISDALVDACLAQDPPRPVTAECAIASGVAFVALRHGGPLAVDAAAIARRTIAEAGYAPEILSAERMTVLVDAARDDAMRGPGAAADRASGGISTVFGHACDHTPEMLPAPLALAHALARALDAARRVGALGALSPDGQAQIAIEFAQRRPTRLRGVALRLGCVETERALSDIEADLRALALRPTLEAAWPGFDEGASVSVALEAAPRGPRAHAGLTGRKTADDCYGAFVRHGSSALSGKDPSRVERAAAYAARHAAKSVVAAGLARECEVQLCYAPDAAAPISVEVDCHGSAEGGEREVGAAVRRGFDFRAGAIAERFGLWTLPAERGGRFYADLAVFGHMGRVDLDPPWERPDQAALR